MCKGILGLKLGMTSIFDTDGSVIPVTVIQAGPCIVTQIKTDSIDGYNALQVSFENRKEKHISRPLKGHLKKSGVNACRYLKELDVEDTKDFTLGQQLTTDLFNIGELVDIAGTTKGRGFAGVIKRHGFKGGRKTHGGRCHRIPGSVGSSAWPSRIIKGKKMPGHFGVEKQTVKNLKIVAIRPDENIILVKGAVPGAKNGLLEIKKLKFV
jgi:large subunit ribosomal protein L3